MPSAFGGYFVGLFATLTIFSTITVSGDKCPMTNDVIVPSNFTMSKSSDFKAQESGLQVYTDAKVPCDGWLTEWRFIAANPLVYGLHLAVFRPLNNLTVQLVNESYLQALATPNGASSVWIYYPVDPPIPVKTGDYLGIFYDKFQTVHDLLTISSKIVTDPKTPPTYVFVMDDTDMKKNTTVVLSKGVKILRIPALTAVITSEVIMTTTAATTLSSNDTSNSTMEGLTSTDGLSTTETTMTTTEMPPTLTIPDQQSRCTNPPTALQVCTRLQLRAYYDYERSTCRPFFGCESWTSDANNFNSVEECQIICMPDVVVTTPPPLGEECMQTPSASTYCYSPGIRYYYDREKKVCSSFYGCPLTSQDVVNNFDTIERCRSRCRVSLKPDVVTTKKPIQIVVSVRGQQSDAMPHRKQPDAMPHRQQPDSKPPSSNPESTRYLYPPAINPFVAFRTIN